MTTKSAPINAAAAFQLRWGRVLGGELGNRLRGSYVSAVQLPPKYQPLYPQIKLSSFVVCGGYSLRGAIIKCALPNPNAARFESQCVAIMHFLSLSLSLCEATFVPSVQLFPIATQMRLCLGKQTQKILRANTKILVI